MNKLVTLNQQEIAAVAGGGIGWKGCISIMFGGYSLVRFLLSPIGRLDPMFFIRLELPKILLDVGVLYGVLWIGEKTLQLGGKIYNKIFTKKEEKV